MKKLKEKLPILIISLVLGIAAFVGILWVERQALKDLEKKEVVVCIADCPVGELITETSVNKYFKMSPVSVELATSTTLSSIHDMIGYYPGQTISIGEIVYKSMLKEDDLAKNLNEPIEISVTAEVDYAVAGRIRKGDVVNVYARKNQGSSYELILTEVVVQNAYDSMASVVNNSDNTALASMFTFCVEASATEYLGALYTGEVAIVKVR